MDIKNMARDEHTHQGLIDMDKNLLRKEIEKELYRKSFYEFFKQAVQVLEPATEWDFNFHHQVIADKLQEHLFRIKNKEKRDKHLIINVPFRSSKSLMISVCFPVWSWIVHNNMSFINLSYSAGLSTDASNKVVELINNPWFRELFEFDFEENHRAKTDFKLRQGGSRISSGFLGAVLGRGADIIICDDPNNIKDLSEVGIKNTIRTWKDTISTRLNNPEYGLFIIVQQRVHHQDMSGYLLKNFADSWEHICLPAMLSPNVKPTYLAEYYQEGLLWKNRFSNAVLNNFKITLGTTTFNNQLQQEATASEGNIIKKTWMRYISPEELTQLMIINNIRRIEWEMYVDTAYGVKGDNTGVLIAAKILGNVYVKKAYKADLPFPDLVKKLQELFNLYQCKIIRIEPKASGLSVIQYLQRNTKLPVMELKNKKDSKETCLNAVSPLIESGRFILVEDVSNDIVVEQLTKFPLLGEDEFIDLTYYALNNNIGSGFNYATT